MNQSSKKPSPSLKITAIPVADAARILASAFGRQVTEDQVREAAMSGDLIRADDTLNLLEYTAYLIHELSREGVQEND